MSIDELKQLPLNRFRYYKHMMTTNVSVTQVSGFSTLYLAWILHASDASSIIQEAQKETMHLHLLSQFIYIIQSRCLSVLCPTEHSFLSFIPLKIQNIMSSETKKGNPDEQNYFGDKRSNGNLSTLNQLCASFPLDSTASLLPSNFVLHTFQLSSLLCLEWVSAAAPTHPVTCPHKWRQLFLSSYWLWQLIPGNISCSLIHPPWCGWGLGPIVPAISFPCLFPLSWILVAAPNFCLLVCLVLAFGTLCLTCD